MGLNGNSGHGGAQTHCTHTQIHARARAHTHTYTLQVAPYLALSLTSYETLKALGAYMHENKPIQKMLGVYKEPAPTKGGR